MKTNDAQFRGFVTSYKKEKCTKTFLCNYRFCNKDSKSQKKWNDDNEETFLCPNEKEDAMYIQQEYCYVVLYEADQYAWWKACYVKWYLFDPFVDNKLFKKNPRYNFEIIL